MFRMLCVDDQLTQLGRISIFEQVLVPPDTPLTPTPEVCEEEQVDLLCEDDAGTPTRQRDADPEVHREEPVDLGGDDNPKALARQSAADPDVDSEHGPAAGDTRDTVQLACVKYFQRASEAMEWLQQRAGQADRLPDLAVIDVDFALDGSDGAMFTPQRAGESSAQLGWIVGAYLRQLCADARKECRIVMYTGKGDVEAGLREAVRETIVRISGEQGERELRVPPFVDLLTKISKYEQLEGIIADEAERVGRREVRSGCAVSTENLIEFEKLVSAGREEWGQKGTEKVLSEFRALLELFPHWGAHFLAMSDTSRHTGELILSACAGADNNWHLCNALKQLKRITAAGETQHYCATPLAALAHSVVFPDGKSYPTSQDLNDWFASCPLPKGTRERLRQTGSALMTAFGGENPRFARRIAREPVTELEYLAWGFGHGASKPRELARQNWESSFEEMVCAFGQRLRANYRCKGSAAGTRLLTDWEAFFGPSEVLEQVAAMSPDKVGFRADALSGNAIRFSVEVSLGGDHQPPPSGGLEVRPKSSCRGGGARLH